MPRRTSREHSPAAWPLFAAMSVDALGTGLYVPLSLLYFLHTTDIGLPLIGTLVSVATALTLPVPLLAGRAADRFGARPVVITGQLVQAAGFFLYLQVSGPVSLMIAVLVEGIGARVYWSSVFTLIAELADADTTGRAKEWWFARASMIRAAGMGAGGMAAGAALAWESTRAYHLLILVNGVSFTVAALLVRSLVRVGPAVRTHPPRTATETEAAAEAGARTEPLGAGHRALLRDRPYLQLILANTAFAVCSTFLTIALPVYVTKGLGVDDWVVGPLLAVNTVLLATTPALVSRFVRRHMTRVRTMALSGLCWTLWCVGSAVALLLPHAALPAFLLLVLLCYTAGELIHEPASNSLAASAAPPSARGFYLAAFQYSFTVGTIVSPVLFTVLFSRRAELPWIVVGGIALLGTALMLPLERRLPYAAVTGEEYVPAGEVKVTAQEAD
ncbi:MFS transporter [Streptomyces chrestomyceticus]|uniref:MFS transporter n=1 Tax=Streptomyces chrestomyceticus TaxID=68185 RepID=UPI0033DB4CF5